MTGYLLRRAAWSVVTLAVIVVASFFLQRIAPGGPFDDSRELAPEVRTRLVEEWSLDEPVPVQLGNYLNGVLSWPPNFKRSMAQPDFTVDEIVLPRLAVSASLGLAAFIVSLLIGVPLGMLAGTRPGGMRDGLVTVTVLLGLSVPNFVLGPLLKRVFALELEWLPESRWVGPSSMVLPVLTLAAGHVAIMARLVRTGFLEVLSEDFMRTARARGLSESALIRRHALRGALVPLAGYLGPALAGLVVGSVVVERIFNIPGLGNTFVDAAFNRDYTLVMGTVMTYSTLLVTMNWCADVAVAYLDPRARTSS